jgi:hypothetical protein
MKQVHERLEKEGWLRQFLADETLARDAVEIYDLLGYEVHLQSPNRLRSRKSDGSSSKETPGQWRMVYIRPKTSPDDEEE